MHEENGTQAVDATTVSKRKQRKPLSPREQARRELDKANGEWVKAADQLDSAKAHFDQCEAAVRDKQAALAKLAKR